MADATSEDISLFMFADDQFKPAVLLSHYVSIVLPISLPLMVTVV